MSPVQAGGLHQLLGAKLSMQEAAGTSLDDFQSASVWHLGGRAHANIRVISSRGTGPMGLRGIWGLELKTGPKGRVGLLGPV